jgi:hypothetical protein
MLSNKLYLLGVPLLNVGVVFTENDLSFRIDSVLDDIRTLLPELAGLHDIELTHEIKVGENQLILNVFLVESLQAGFDFNDNKSLLEVKEIMIEAIKRLPIKMNLLMLDDQSLSSKALDFQDDKDADRFKKLIRKNQKSALKFLLADESFYLSFPEMAPYLINSDVKHIEFKIEYIHSRYLRVKLLHDGVTKLKNKKQLYLMTSIKMRDDDFYNMCTEALRSHKVVSCNAISYVDNFNNEILAMEVV